MCGRFTHLQSWTEIHAQLQAFIDVLEVGPGVVEQPLRANIAPTQPIAVIYRDVDSGGAKIDLMRWGLIPTWVKDPQNFALIFNARMETLGQKPAFRGGLRHRRCLIPASGYYEWQKASDGAKQPFYITPKGKESLLFAGLYADWMGPDGSQLYSVTLITVPANPELETIHPRTPALISRDLAADWLDVKGVNEAEAARMLGPAPLGMLDVWPVSKRVNSARNDGPDLTTPLTGETAPDPAPARPARKAARKVSGQGELF